MKSRNVVLIAFLVVALSVQGCTQQQTKAPYKLRPLPTGAKVHTEKDFMQAVQRFRQRNIVEQFKKHGPHDPKWNDKAVSFMEAYAKYGAETKEVDLLAVGQELAGLGCDAPSFLACYGHILFVKGKRKEAEPILRQALDGLQKSTYPRCRALAIPRDLIEITRGRGVGQDTQEEKDLLSLAVDLMVKSTADGSYLQGEQPIMYLSLSQALLGIYPNRYKEIYRMIAEKPGGDPYFHKVVAGTYECMLAWEARGDGWAYQVTPEGWKGFEKHLALARKELVAAWKLHPGFSPAATQMIGVAMGSDDPAEPPRLWFDRAVAAQFDDMAAYKCLLWAMRPRWGGSLDEIHKFGVECLNTGRFDTNVPMEYFYAFRATTFQPQFDGDADYPKKPEVYQHLKALWEGYGKAGVYTPEQVKTLEATSACECFRYETAKAILDELGDKADPGVVERVCDRQLPVILRNANAYGGDCGKEMIKAYGLNEASKKSEALAVYKAVVSKTKDTKYTLPLAQSMVVSLETEHKFAGSDWVDVTPTEIGKGWTSKGGAWSVKDGVVQLVTNLTDHENVLVNCADFTKYFEVKCDIEAIPAKNWCFDCGVMFRLPAIDLMVLIDPGADSVRICHPFADLATVTNAGIKQNNQLLIEYRNAEITVYLNGELKTKSKLQVQNYDPELPSLCLYGSPTEGSVVRYKNIQVRRLADKPENH